MKIKSRKYLDVFYDPDLRNWNKAIDQELKRLGLQDSQVIVICRPIQRLKGAPRIETQWTNRAGGGGR